MAETIVARPKALQIGPVEGRGIGWNGMVCLIASEAMLFAFLLFSYYYLGAVGQRGWVPSSAPDLTLSLPDTLLLLASSVTAWWAEQGVRKERKGQALAGLAVTFAMGAVFTAVQVVEWGEKHFGPGSSSFGALYFVTTAFHMAHVVVGLAIIAALFGWTARGYFSHVRLIPVSNGVIYWHFVDAVWLAVFATYYLTPRLGFGT